LDEQEKLVYVKKSGFDGKKHASSVDSMRKGAANPPSLEESPSPVTPGVPKKPSTRLRLLGGSVATRTERLSSFSQGAVRIARDAASSLRPRFFSNREAGSAKDDGPELEDVEMEEALMPVEAIDSSALPYQATAEIGEPAWQEEQRKLQEALVLLRSGAELEPSAQQVVQTKEMQGELASRNLCDKQALAFCLIFKLGSLDNAFAYLNCFGSGNFAKVTWETALLVLHMEVFNLTGLSRHQIFRDMSEGSDQVTKELWEQYFTGVDIEDARDGRKAREQKSNSQPRASPPRAPRREVSEEPLPKEVVAPPKEVVEEVLPTPPAPTAPEDKGEGENSTEPGEEEVPPPQPPRKASHDGKMRRAVQATMAARRLQKKPGKGSAGAGADEPEKERSDKPRKKTRRLSTEKFPTEDTSGAVVEEKEDDEAFIARVTKILEDLPVDTEAMIECSSRHQKSMLLEAARERDYFATAWRSGVLVANEGGEARRLRAAVSEVGCGFTKLKAPKLLESFGRSLTEDAGMTVLETEDCFEGDQAAVLMDVLQDRGTQEELEHGAEELLSSLAENEIKSFALAAQSQFRAALIKVATAKGMEIATAGDGHIQVGKLELFDASVQETIRALQEGDSHNFGFLPNLKKQVVRRRSQEEGLMVDDTDSMVRIQRPTRSPTFIDKASALEELRRVTDAVFKSCATGRLAHQIFMRRQDLVKLFDEELAERNDFRTSVDRVYDDTLQLQLDMNGQNYGLSKEYFQVFLTKASNELGWRPNMDALLALEKAIEEKEDDEPALESDREEELS